MSEWIFQQTVLIQRLVEKITARIPYSGKLIQIQNEEMKEFQMDCHL